MDINTLSQVEEIVHGKKTWDILNGNVLDLLSELPDNSVHCCITSPPYWSLRAYGTDLQVWGGDPSCAHVWTDAPYSAKKDGGRDFLESNGKWVDHAGSVYTAPSFFCQECDAWKGELGAEPTIELFIKNMVQIFHEVKRVLHPTGTCWINIGDSYAGSGKGPTGKSGIGDQAKRQGFVGGTESDPKRGKGTGGDDIKAKDLCLIPEELAIALRKDGWWVRSKIAWIKSAAMPESVRDRPSASWEIIWMLTKEGRYYYDSDAVRSEGETYQVATPSGWDSRPGAHNKITGHYEKVYTEEVRSGSNLRNHWEIEVEGSDSWKLSPQHFDGEYCFGCERLYDGDLKKQVSNRCPECGYTTRKKVLRIRDFDGNVRTPCPGCGVDHVRWERVCPVCNSSDDWVSHFAAFPDKLVELCIKAGSSEYVCDSCLAPFRKEAGVFRPGCGCTDPQNIPSIVLDPFSGTGTTVMVARRLGRAGIGIELNPKYYRFSVARIREDQPLFN